MRFEWHMNEFKTKVGQSGSIVIPTEYRRKLGLEAGDEIIMHLGEEGLRLYTPAQAVARAQALVRRYVPEGRSLSEELISERRSEAERE
jgi:AbrB family looped-hinge helix DNA binding protein